MFFLTLFFLFQSNPVWTKAERGVLINGLHSTADSIIHEFQNLSEDEWEFQENAKRWSIHYIVEHIYLQDMAYYRELKALADSPVRTDLPLLKENDQIFIDYATDPIAGIADWDVEPTGRFCSITDALTAFKRLRAEMESLIRQTNSDFRQIYTFRNIPASVIRKNPTFYNARLRRDLHQLILTDIAHSKRHLKQIQNVKKNQSYPNQTED